MTEDINTGCSYEEFESTMRKLTYGKEEFQKYCEVQSNMTARVLFSIAQGILVVQLIWKCVKTAIEDHKKEIIKKNLHQRGALDDTGRVKK